MTTNPAGPDDAGPSSATDVPAVVPTTAGAAEDRGPGPASHPVAQYYRDMAAHHERAGRKVSAKAAREMAEHLEREAAIDAALEEGRHVGRL